MAAKNEVSDSSNTLAPCGMICQVCYRRLRLKNPCPGTGIHCLTCRIGSCAAGKHISHCFFCESFPCRYLHRLDTTYVKTYGVSLVAFGSRAKELGIDAFLTEELSRWTCECGGIISLHDNVCSSCKKRVSQRSNSL